MNKGFQTYSGWRTWFLSLGIFIAAALLSLAGCTSPQAVAIFADSAQKVLDQGPPLFHDLHDSCIRRHTGAEKIVPVFLPTSPTPPTSPVCSPFAQQGDALAKASDILSAYFRAMHELASFDTSSVSTATEQAAENAATGAQLNDVQIDSVGKLAGLITQIFTEHYQRSRLMSYVRTADPAVASVTQGFETIVSKDYESLLHEEQQTIAARYQNVVDPQNLAAVLLLNRAYTDDVNEINRRKAAADAYVEALKQIREGHHKLTEKGGHLNVKELGLALASYTTRLQALLPIVQKGL